MKLLTIMHQGETTWRRHNHYLDAGYAAMAAGEFIRSKTERWQAAQEQPEAQPATLTTEDGRPYVLTERV